MRDVSAKPTTLRVAVAKAIVSLDRDPRPLLELARADKGDPLEAARIAGSMAAKRTWELIPHCHQVPVAHVGIEYELEDETILIESVVRCIAPTGVEMEALTAASVAALTIYDMLKPHTDQIVVTDIRLLSKRGGKGDYGFESDLSLRAAVLVVSDSVSSGQAEDKSGKAVVEALGLEPAVSDVAYYVLPDEPQELRQRAEQLVEDGIDLLITVGGTGLGPRDRTVEALEPLLERVVPGIMETARAYGQHRTRYAMLSRGIAGTVGDTLVLTFPGSSAGAIETYRSLFPPVLHLFQMLRNTPHSHGHS